MAYPKGIDVASYQSSTFSLSGLSFVFVKSTESNNYINPKYKAQIAHVRTSKATLGHYHFIRPGAVQAQADYFLAHSDIKAGDVIALDWEDSGVSGANKDAWIKYVKTKKPSAKVGLYCNVSFWKTKDTTSYCGDYLWIADPSAPDGKPSISHVWTFQQTGISGTDVDIANFASAAALTTWAGGKAPTPTPSPEDDVSLTAADKTWIAANVARADDVPACPPPYNNGDYFKPDGKTPNNTSWTQNYALGTIALAGRQTLDLVKKLGTPTLTDDQVSTIGAAIAGSPALVDALAEAIADKLAARLQS